MKKHYTAGSSLLSNIRYHDRAEWTWFVWCVDISMWVRQKMLPKSGAFLKPGARRKKKEKRKYYWWLN